MRSVIESDLVPNIQVQLLVRALFLLCVAVILIFAVLYAIRAMQKALHGEKSVDFSIVKGYTSSYRWGFIGLGALCAILFILLFVDQMMKLIRILFD